MRNDTIKRYSGIESLRLLAMLGIVICHGGARKLVGKFAWRATGKQGLHATF